MTRMAGPDCVVMCNLINTHTHTHTHIYIDLCMYGVLMMMMVPLSELSTIFQSILYSLLYK